MSLPAAGEAHLLKHTHAHNAYTNTTQRLAAAVVTLTSHTHTWRRKGVSAGVPDPAGWRRLQRAGRHRTGHPIVSESMTAVYEAEAFRMLQLQEARLQRYPSDVRSTYQDDAPGLSRTRLLSGRLSPPPSSAALPSGGRCAHVPQSSPWHTRPDTVTTLRCRGAGGGSTAWGSCKVEALVCCSLRGVGGCAVHVGGCSMGEFAALSKPRRQPGGVVCRCMSAPATRALEFSLAVRVCRGVWACGDGCMHACRLEL